MSSCGRCCSFRVHKAVFGPGARRIVAPHGLFSRSANDFDGQGSAARPLANDGRALKAKRSTIDNHCFCPFTLVTNHCHSLTPRSRPRQSRLDSHHQLSLLEQLSINCRPFLETYSTSSAINHLDHLSNFNQPCVPLPSLLPLL
jgi:hypothetical protein